MNMNMNNLTMKFESTVLMINTAMIFVSKYFMIVMQKVWGVICRMIEKVRNMETVYDLEDKLVTLKRDIGKDKESYNLTNKFNKIQERRTIRKFVSLKEENKEMKLKLKMQENLVLMLQDEKRKFCYNLQQADNHIYHLNGEIDRLRNQGYNNRGYNNNRHRQDNRRQDNRRQDNRRQDNRRQDNRQRSHNGSENGPVRQQSMYRGGNQQGGH